MVLRSSSSKRALERALEEKFRDACGGKASLSFSQFVDVTGCRSSFFAQRLFEKMDADSSGDVTFTEFIEIVHILQSRDTERRKRFIFDLFDLDHNGFITESELRSTLAASLEEGDFDATEDERADLVNTLVDLFDVGENDAISYEEFSYTLDLYPDLLEGFSLEGIAVCSKEGETEFPTTQWSATKRWIFNRTQGFMTYTFLALILIGCFLWRFQAYARECVHPFGNPHERLHCSGERKRDLMGWSLPIAKGCGQAMKVIFSLILLPVSRNLMTNLRSTFLVHFFNFDASIDFHKTLGTIGFLLAWIHTLCHICDLKRWSDPDRRDLYFKAFPDDNVQPSFQDLLATSVVITGTTMITVFSIAAMFAFDYPRKFLRFSSKSPKTRFRSLLHALGRFLNDFNHFWITHHLFIIFYLALLFHPLPALPNEAKEWGVSDSWLWIFVPVLIYLSERIARSVINRIRATAVLSADVLPGNVVELKIMKPRGFVYIAGQYVFLNCPQLSKFEWHPFTLTSSPGDSFLSVHIRVNGDWTQALYDSVERHWKTTEDDMLTASTRRSFSAKKRTASVILRSVSGISTEVVPGSFPFDIKVDGPFGAPAQNYKDYKIVVLIGAGIGVTPFASVLNDILDVMQNHKCPKCGAINLPKTLRIRKVYFYWTVRSRKEAAWFKHVLEAIGRHDDSDYIEMNIHITSFRRADDLRMMLLRLAQYHGSEHGVDPLAGIRTRAVTNFGRPNWNIVFQKIKAAHKDETHHCGVFYCGPNSLRKVLLDATRKHSSNEMIFDLNTEMFG